MTDIFLHFIYPLGDSVHVQILNKKRFVSPPDTFYTSPSMTDIYPLGNSVHVQILNKKQVLK